MSTELAEEKETASLTAPPLDAMTDEDDAPTGSAQSPDGSRAAYTAPPEGPFAELTFLALRQMAAARKAARDARDAQMERLVHHTSATKRKTPAPAATAKPAAAAESRNHLSRAQKAQKLAKKQTIAEALESARKQQKEKQAERAAAAANKPQPTASAKSARPGPTSANGRATTRPSTSASMPAWLAVDEPASLPAFIKRGQSLDLVLNDKQLRGWVAEAVIVWQRMAEEKRKLHGPKQRKFGTAGQNGAKSTAPPKAKQQPQPIKPVAPQERKPSVILPPPIIEDSLLPSYSASPPLPSSSALFVACPAGSLTDVVRAFDLVSTYRDVLYVGAARDMTMPMFLQAVLTEPSSAENQLLNTVMAALVRAVLRNAPATTSTTSTATAATLQQINGKPFAFQRSIQSDTLAQAVEEEEVSEGVVVNALTWQKHLQDWLVDDSLRWIHRKKWREHRILSAFLSIDTFYQLALPQRLYIVELLARIAVRSPYMRFYFATALDTVATTRKQLQAAKNAQIHQHREMEQNSAEVAQCVVDLVDAVCRRRKKERESGHTAHSLQKHEKAWLRLDGDRQLKEWEMKVEECVEQWKLRTVSVGCDRYWNRYWLFGGRTDVLVIHHSDEYVKRVSDKEQREEDEKNEERQRLLARKREEEEAKQGKEEKDEQQRMNVDSSEHKLVDDHMSQAEAAKRAAPPRWSAVTDSEGLNALLSWLNPSGIREKALRETLSAVKWTWRESAAVKAEGTDKAPTIKEEAKEQASKVKEEAAVKRETPNSAQTTQQPLTISPPTSTAVQPSLLTPKASVPATSSVARAWSLGRSNPASLLSYDYTSIFELNKHSLRAMLVLMSDVDEANSYARCGICQDQFTKKELHCPACHSNIDLQPSKEGQGMLEHMAACRGDDGVRKPRINSLYYVDEQDRERNEVTVDLDATIVPTKRLRKKTDESSESESGEDEENEEEEEEKERQRERLEREDEQEADQPPPLSTEEEGKDAANLSQDGTALVPTAAASSGSPSQSPTPLTKAKLVTQHRVTPRPTSMSTLSPILLTLKALVLDIEAAIPVEAVRSRNQAARLSWVEGMKMASSMRAIGRGLSELGRNLRAGWVKSWFDSEGWQQRLRMVQSESGFAACLFEFDRALIYSEDEQQQEEKRQATREETNTVHKGQSESEDEEQDEENREGCRICRSTDDPDTMLLCDGCDLEHHMACLQPPLRSIPKGKWFCPNCRKTAGGKAAAAGSKKDKSSSKSASSKSKSSRASGGSKKAAKATAPALVYTFVEPEMPADYGICKKCHINEGDPLLCDRCDDAYHLQCASPPLDSVPEGDWFCGPCKEEMREEEEAKQRKKEKAAVEDEEEFKLEADVEEQEAEAENEEEEADEAEEDEEMDEEEEEEEEDEEEEKELEEEPKPRKRLLKRAKKDSDTENEDGDDDLNATTEPQTDDDEEAEYVPAGGSSGSGSKQGKKAARSVGEEEADDEEADWTAAASSPSPVPASEEEMSSSGTTDDCCSVCFFPHSPADNPILYCDGCNQTVHVHCQGLDAVPKGDFFCDRCAAGLPPDTTDFPCVLCRMPLSAGAMRQVEAGSKKGEWVHLACCIFYPKVTFDDIPHRRGIKFVDAVPEANWGHRCLCCQLQAGATVKCDACERWMHVPCALASTGCVMYWDVKQGKPVKRCPDHNSAWSPAPARAKSGTMALATGRHRSEAR